jgi:probable phosphoglycerate mutase
MSAVPNAPENIDFSAGVSNNYSVLRHGRSVANDQNVIVSDPRFGLENFGLTNTGQLQVNTMLQHRWKQISTVTIVLASDFLRTRETATIVAGQLQLEIQLSPLLRERYFGDWEGLSCDHYLGVWQQDAVDPMVSRDQVESVAAVANRMQTLIWQTEQQYQNEHILLVSHGDPLQILLTAMAGENLRQHRAIPKLQTAELRVLPVTLSQ